VDLAAHYGLSNEHPKPEYPSVDLFASEQQKGRLLIKIGALACFVLASALLAASLLLPPPAQVGTDTGAPGAFTGSLH